MPWGQVDLPGKLCGDKRTVLKLKNGKLRLRHLNPDSRNLTHILKLFVTVPGNSKLTACAKADWMAARVEISVKHCNSSRPAAFLK